MGAGDVGAWRGRRHPYRLPMAAVSVALVAILTLGYWMGGTGGFRVDAGLVTFLVAWAAATVLSAVTWIEGEVRLRGPRMEVVIREGLGRWCRERVSRVRREDLAKVRERGLPGATLSVTFEDREGSRLAIMPRFLDRAGHDGMIAAVLDWGGQPSPGEGGRDVPEAESR